MPTLLSVNVGMPKDVGWNGRTVRTGIWKESVPGRRMVRRLNIDGDGQGDLLGHGGEMRAVLVYQIQSYDHWRRHLGREDFVHGQFGENLTVNGMPDDEVCIGDRYRIGEAEFEVTQPRVTCYRVGLRMGHPDMPSLLVAHHRPGFYMRVITEGRIEAGDDIVRTRAGPGGLSVADADALLYLPGRDITTLRLALTIPALSPGWQGSFRTLLAAAETGAETGAGATVPRGTTEPGWTGFRPLRVRDVVRETDTVTSILLVADDGRTLPPARGGQYLTVRVAGAGQPAPVRSYSLSAATGSGSYRLSVKRETHGLVSGYLHGSLRPGSLLDAAAPRGGFLLDDADGPVVLISAGIGVTPLLAMLAELAADHSRREVWWLHGARSAAEHALADEAHHLLASLPDARERVYYSSPDAARPAPAHASAGRLTGDRIRGLGLPPDASAYICGPQAFMTDIRGALVAAGIQADHIHTETFGALGAINPGLVDSTPTRPHPPPGPPGTGPLVTFARSGLEVPFDAAHRSILELAERCGVPTRWACRTGVCHTCETALLSGAVTYSPDPLEPPAAGRVLICCARPTADVVLDM